ncbi:hypothetical protein KAH85_04415 [Candidatus Bathyarchaeota archaeon]|nr:hypothetical protein [Candidatus Bathyarchaeota archaeon]
MKNTIETIRRKYRGFKKGAEDALAVRDQVHLALEEARKEGNDGIAEELEEMLMDLEFSIQESKC